MVHGLNQIENGGRAFTSTTKLSSVLEMTLSWSRKNTPFSRVVLALLRPLLMMLQERNRVCEAASSLTSLQVSSAPRARSRHCKCWWRSSWSDRLLLEQGLPNALHTGCFGAVKLRNRVATGEVLGRGV